MNCERLEQFPSRDWFWLQIPWHLHLEAVKTDRAPALTHLPTLSMFTLFSPSYIPFSSFDVFLNFLTTNLKKNIY